MVLEYLEGGTLSDNLSCNKHNENEVKSIMRSILKCIEFIHEKGIMHRNIKLENFIFSIQDDYTILKLVDFEYAQFFNDSEFIIKKCGSLGFIAPELFHKNLYDEKCDIFSAGVIFYILLTGNFLFEAKTES
jgi:serine/threonine protein kinase